MIKLTTWSSGKPYHRSYFSIRLDGKPIIVFIKLNSLMSELNPSFHGETTLMPFLYHEERGILSKVKHIFAFTQVKYYPVMLIVSWSDQDQPNPNQTKWCCCRKRLSVMSLDVPGMLIPILYFFYLSNWNFTIVST